MTREELDATVLWNPGSGSAIDAEPIAARIAAWPGMRVRRLEPGEDLVELAEQCNSPLVVAAGGDGTVSATLSGVLKNPKRPDLAILPLGTGNDFARSLEIPLDLDLAFETIVGQPERRLIDIVWVDDGRTRRPFLNLAAGGNSHLVSEATTEEAKKRWGALSYIANSLARIGDLVQFDTSLAFDDEGPIQRNLVNVVVANGGFVAGGVPICPEADPSDGLFDVLLFEDGSLASHAALGARLMLGVHVDSERVTHRRARKLEIAARPTMAFSADGELLEPGRMTFEIEPEAQTVLTPSRRPRET